MNWRTAFPASELRTRVMSGSALAIAAVTATFVGSALFVMVWLVAASAVAFEWLRLVGAEPLRVATALAIATLTAASLAVWAGSGQLALPVLFMGAIALAWVAPTPNKAAAAAGVGYAALTVLPIVAIRFDPLGGIVAVLWVFAVVWGTDVAAYFVGRAVGGPKLWPSVSPKKTWAGFVGGAVVGAGAGYGVGTLAAVWLGPWALSGLALLGAGLLCSLASQGGDLFESAFKRQFGAKDSGDLIPGHGGAMDRLDSFAPASLVALILIWLAS